MLHLVVPARDVSGKLKVHPPEFWEAEREMFPERGVAWAWMIAVLGSCLRVVKRQECTFVKPSWKRLMCGERRTLEQITALLKDGPPAASEKAEPLL